MSLLGSNQSEKSLQTQQTSKVSIAQNEFQPAHAAEHGIAEQDKLLQSQQAPTRSIASWQRLTGPGDTPNPSFVPPYFDIVPGFRMGIDEANRALCLYRSIYTPYFPFVPIPTTLTALELYNTAPFLLRTILQLTAPQTPEIHKGVGRWFRQYISQHVVVEQERRLEFLQAILVYVAW